MGFVCVALTVYYFLLFARILLAWFPRPPESLRPIVEFIFAVTDPPLRLARPLIPPLRVGMTALDLSPLLVFFLILLLQRIVCS